MLTGITGLPLSLVLCGIIWAVVLGVSAGNYACSLVHRLPRGRSILAEKPYCGHCRTPLAVKDLFPVVSALLLRHRCRYCGTPYPTSHTWTELLVALLFVLCFFAFGFSERFCLVALLGIFLIIQASIEHNEKLVLRPVMLVIAVAGMLLRTLEDGTIFEFFEGGFMAMLLGLVLWRRQVQKVNHSYSFPLKAQLLTVAGLCVGMNRLPLFLLLLLVFWLLSRIRDRVFTVPYGLAVILPMLYPEWGVLPLLHALGAF